MRTVPVFEDLWWTLRQGGNVSPESNTETTTIIIAVVAVLVMICIIFFVGRVLMFRRRTHVHQPVDRRNGADNDYLMYAYLQTQSPSVVRMRRLANADGLSVQELNEAAPVKTFSKVPDSSDDNVCAVCLEEMEVDAKTRKMPCGHEFDARCIEEWVSKANRCPVCNTHVVEEETLQKRRIATLEGRDSSPPHTRHRRRRARGEHGGYEIHDSRRISEQEQRQENVEADIENQGGAEGASDLQLDVAVMPGRAAAPPRSELGDEGDQEARLEGSARPTQVVRPAEV